MMKLNHEQLRYAAFRKRLSGREIARISGMSPATVCNILRGKQEPTATKLAKICSVLQIPMEMCFTTKSEGTNNANRSENTGDAADAGDMLVTR